MVDIQGTATNLFNFIGAYVNPQLDFIEDSDGESIPIPELPSSWEQAKHIACSAGCVIAAVYLSNVWKEMKSSDPTDSGQEYGALPAIEIGLLALFTAKKLNSHFFKTFI